MYKVCLVITYKYICILACSGCQIEKYQRDPPVCFNKEKGCIVYVLA